MGWILRVRYACLEWFKFRVRQVMAPLFNDVQALRAEVSMLRAQMAEWEHNTITEMVTPMAAPAPIVAIQPDILEAIKNAFGDKGLPLEAFSETFDVARSGKLNDIIHHVADTLNTKHPLRTVADVARLFS